ncbi:MAG: extracellular solute-binding protein [Candidatus Fimadaptatus sp.]
MLKRTLVMLLAAMMLLTALPALGDASTDGWDVPYAEPVQVHVALEEIVNAVFAEGEDMTDNLWTRRFKEKYNVEVIVDWISIEYDTKLNLAIASNTLPDIFKCNTVQFNQLKDAGRLLPLNDAYETNASPSMKKMMEDNWDIVETAMVGEDIMGMPRLHYGYECLTSFAWIRDDWAQANGITELKTVDDITAMMDAFMTNNGAKYGVMLDKTLACFYEMAPVFHATPKIWVEDENGQLVYGSTLQETKDALRQWADWYAAGYVRPDFGTLDNAAMLEDAYKGNTGFYCQQNWAGWSVGKDMIENLGEGTYMTAHDLPSVDDKPVMFPIAFPNSVYNVVNANYDHPEVLMKLTSCYIDVLNDSVSNGTMTIEEALPFGSNDMHHVTGPFKVEFTSYNDTKEVCNALTTGDETFSTGYAYIYYNEARKWPENGDLTSLGRYLQMGYDGASLVRSTRYVDNEQLIKSKLWGAQPQAMLDYGTTLDDLLVEGFTQIIMGVESIDYFDALIESWYMAGGEQVTAAVNEMYGNK